MSDEKFTKIPQNKNDLEYNQYGLSVEGKVGVRVVDSLKGSTGEYIDVYLGKEFTKMLELVTEMNENLAIVVNHLREITQINSDNGEIF